MKSRLRTHLTWLSLLVKSEIIPDFSRSESRYPELASLCCSIISDTLADISQDKWGWENFFLPTLKDHIEVEINQFLVWFWFPIVGCIRLRHPTNGPKCHDMHKVKPQQCTLGVYPIGNDSYVNDDETSCEDVFRCEIWIHSIISFTSKYKDTYSSCQIIGYYCSIPTNESSQCTNYL